MPNQFTSRPLTERVWDRVQRSEGCWIWTGATDGRRGYGRIRSHGSAHRFMYELTYGPIPSDLIVCHHCDNPPCVRPDHLFLGTAVDNVADRVAKGRTANGAQHARRKQPELSRGTNNGRAKLTEDAVREIRRLYAENSIRQVDLAKRFGVNQTVISAIVLRQRWKHVN